jgi:hypothetical protein
LTGGYSSCDTSYLDSPDYYGKFSWSWDKNGSDSTKRLKDWLDPDNTGVMNLNGVALGVPVLPGNVAIKVSPNPFTERIQLKIDGENGETARIDILNLMGQTLWSGDLIQEGSSPLFLSFPSLSPGIYFLKITFPNAVSTIKLIKR